MEDKQRFLPTTMPPAPWRHLWGKTGLQQRNCGLCRGPTVRLKLWLQEGDEVFFGTGRVLLLDLIEQHGSLKEAASALGMSYRAAWGKLKATEKALGIKLVETRGSKRKGYMLTAEGRHLRDMFRSWFQAVEEDALESARRIFPWPIQAYSDGEDDEGGRKPPHDRIPEFRER